MAKERLERLVNLAADWPGRTIAIVLVLAVAGGLLALRLKPSTGIDTFVSSSSASYQATQDDHRHFGDDAVIILLREPLTDLVQTKDLATITELEACLGGQVVTANQQLGSFTPVPRGTKPPYGGWNSPCGELMKTQPVQVVYGPGTFLNRAVAAVNTQINSLLTSAQQAVTTRAQQAYQLALGEHLSRAQALTAAEAAAQIEQQQEQTQLAQLYLDSGISGTPRIDDPQFIPQIVFDQTRGVNQPKARFAYLFPTANSALIQVRLKSSLSDSQQAKAISLIRAAIKMPMFRSAYGGTYTVTGAPVVINDLASQITGSIAILLLAALVVMAVTLLIVFRGKLRLLPLAIALAAAGITFGLTSVLGASLTMASIAVLPILIGLAVDYAIQFQSRANEARGIEAASSDGEAPDEHEVVARAASRGVPAIAVAALATATGFLVLLLSPVPMVQGFGLLLVLGIAIAFVCAITGGSAVMVLAAGGRRRPRKPASARARRRRRVAQVRGPREVQVLLSSLWGAEEIVRDAWTKVRNGRAVRKAAPIVRSAGRAFREAGVTAAASLGRLRREPTGTTRTFSAGRPRASRTLFVRRVLDAVTGSPIVVLQVAVVLALGGWVLDTQTSVQSDVTKLVPSNMRALRDLHTLEHVTGVSGEIDVTVRSSDVTQLSTVNWMIAYEQKLLTHFGYLETKGCAQSTLCPALSLPDLFSAGIGGAQGSASSGLTQASIRNLLSAVPTYFSQAVITPDHREATLAFGIRLMPLSRQQQVIDYMRSQLHPPSGVNAQLTGLPVLAAQANDALSSPVRRLLTLLAGLIAVGLVLQLVFRNTARALVPLVPIALATGWSALILYATRIPLNPMSATLGALVIAISTEFSVLLSERFRQERNAGYGQRDALRRTYESTGMAVLASGITAIAGFGVLILSDITMLRDFGLVTLIDLSVSLVGVLLVLPAVLALAEREEVWERFGRLEPDAALELRQLDSRLGRPLRDPARVA